MDSAAGWSGLAVACIAAVAGWVLGWTMRDRLLGALDWAQGYDAGARDAERDLRGRGAGLRVVGRDDR